MAQQKQDWEKLGRNIQEIVDQAVNSRDYEKLNQTIRQTVNRVVDFGEETVRKVRDTGAKQAEPIVIKPDLSAYYGPTGGRTAIGILKIVGGGVLCALSVSLLLASTVIGLVMAASPAGLPIGALIALAVGGGLIAGGVGNLKLLSRFRRYRKLLGDKTHCSVARLAESVGKSEKFIRREVRKLIAWQLLPEGHLDQEGQTLIISDETYRQFEQSRLQLEQRQREQKQLEAESGNVKPDPSTAPQTREVLEKGSRFLAEIRRCNDRIPGWEISEKISRIEQLVQRIFQRTKTNPEVIPDLKKMMDYYLPMTVKLLNAYADMDAQPVQGETISASKREIEQTLDTLNVAFEKLLDSIFEDTAMDISSDISVLNTLLAQEGLTEDGLSQIKKQRTGE